MKDNDLSPYVEHIIQPGILDWSKDIEAPDELIDLTVGQPDYEVPCKIIKSLCKAAQNGFNKYQDSQGVEELRTKILDIQKANSTQDVVITNGVTGGLFLTLMTCFSPGDEILLADPYFIQYKILIEIFQLQPRYISTYPDFKMSLSRVKRACTANTKAIILNYPNNPTGTVLDVEEFNAIMQFAKQNNIIIIFDEIYEAYSYISDTKLDIPSLASNVIVLGGFSKKYCMTGWRIGYLIAKKELVQYITELQAQMCQSVNSVTQYAAIDALETDVQYIIEEYRKRNEFVKNNLHCDYFCSDSKGGLFFFIKVPSYFNMNGTQFCMMMKKRGVLLVPGRIFSQIDTHFRLAICKNISELKRAVMILNEVCYERRSNI